MSQSKGITEIIIQHRTDQQTSPQPVSIFSRPQVLGCYSLDDKRTFIDGPEHLRFCEKVEAGQHESENRFNLDLDKLCTEEYIQAVAIDDNEKRRKENSQMKHIINWIDTHKDIFEENRPDFVMRRGVMRKILGLPYDKQVTVMLAAMYKNGTIYLRKIGNQSEEKCTKFHSDEKHKRLSCWGINFEHFLLADEPSGAPDPVNPRKGECDVVFTARLNQYKILYAAETDGIWINNSGNPLNPKETPEDLAKCQFIELKTAKEMPNGHTYAFRRYKTRTWWCQAVLGRVSEILVGFRNDAGIVRQKPEVMQVNDLANEALEWSPRVCFNFMAQFLDRVAQIVRENTEAVCLFHYDPKLQTTDKDYCCKITVTVEKDSDKLLPDLF